jgi:DNA-binding beta-propeller fold protein YncE
MRMICKCALRQAALGVLCTMALALSAGVSSVKAAPSDPLFVFTPEPPPSPLEPPKPPPTGYLEGPCGIAVDSSGGFYVSDYYHHAIDVFSSGAVYLSQLAPEDPLDGPCGLALDPSDNLYVNNFHRNVARFGPSFAPGPIFEAAHHPTGLAVDPATGDLYVNDRTYIAHYEAPVEAGEEPAEKIGLGSLQDGYGLAFSSFPATAGLLYVADAKDETVKVYDPETDLADPLEVIEGQDLPTQGFTSLRDSALAVDRLTGELYVADNLQPAYTEQPQAQIDVFSSLGAYEGHLKHLIVDALPPGLAVDNSAGSTQGRVYVTSGNTIEASVYAYRPGAATTTPALCVPFVPCPGEEEEPLPGGAGAASGVSAPDLTPERSRTFSKIVAQASKTLQRGPVRIALSGRLSPHRLPRRGQAPVSVSVGWKLESSEGGEAPQLKRLAIEINRHGIFDFTGLPTCPYGAIQPASSQRALANCRSALVGKGAFGAEVALAGQEGYPAHGRLLLFNGKSAGKPVLFGHIYSSHPFATSFVIPFALKQARGTYGTALSASLPASLERWGNLTEIEMTLARRYRYRGQSHSFLSAGCPAPKGFGKALFPLARTSFAFAGGTKLGSVLTDTCRARG